jgi:hypothetical protein
MKKPESENLSAQDWLAKVKASRWGLMCKLRGITGGRAGRCRSRRTAATVQIVRPSYGGVSLVGVETCGSVWACPVCASRICAERANQVRDLVADWGGTKVVMVTCTVRHARTDQLSRETRGVAKAWQSLWQGKAVAAAKERWGIGPWVRCVEVTHGRNGWHAHVHAILCLRRELADPRELQQAWATRWQSAVGSHLGMEAVPDELHGVNVSPVRDTDYLVKLGLEVAGARKLARAAGSAHPWDLADLAAGGDPMGTMLWGEYVSGTRGHRQLTWSGEARAMKRADAEIAKPVREGALVCEFSGEDWKKVVARTFGIAEVMQIARDSVGE